MLFLRPCYNRSVHVLVRQLQPSPQPSTVLASIELVETTSKITLPHLLLLKESERSGHKRLEQGH